MSDFTITASDITDVNAELERLADWRALYKADKEKHDEAAAALHARKLDIEALEEAVANHLYGRIGTAGVRQIRWLSESERL